MRAGVERDYDAPHAPARAEDPSEAKAAARTVKVARDRMAILRVFTTLNLTYRQAGIMAAEHGASTARLESLRRRGSDLKELGWIEQCGRTDGQAVFRITPEGRKAHDGHQAR